MPQELVVTRLQYRAYCLSGSSCQVGFSMGPTAPFSLAPNAFHGLGRPKVDGWSSNQLYATFQHDCNLHPVLLFGKPPVDPATSHLGVMDAGGSTLQQLSDSCWMALATRLRGALEKESTSIIQQDMG